MSEKNNSTKTSGIGLKDKIGYAMGDMGGLMTFGLIGSFLQLFYTDVLRIEVSKITVLFLVARIWDAINDPIWGSLIDRRKPSKAGKFRPYLKSVSIPLAIAGFVMFIKIPGLSQTQYLIYAYITYIAYGMLYTAINIPYGSLASVITSDEIERSSLSVFRSLGAGIGGLPASILLPLLVYTKSDVSGEKALDPTKLMIGVGIMALLSIIVYYGSYKLTKERISFSGETAAQKSGVFKTILSLLKNRPFIVLCLSSMLLIATQQYTQTVYNYLFIYYFKQPGLYALTTICTYFPMLVLMPPMAAIIKKFGKKEVCGIGMGFAAAMNLILFFIKTSNPYIFLAFCLLTGLGMTFLVLEVWALVTDVIDYQELLSGKREEGTSYACYSFTRKLGQTIAGVLGTQVLEFIGYDNTSSASVIVTQETAMKMYNVSALIPAAMCGAMFILLTFLYPLTKEKLRNINSNKEQA